MKEEPKADRKQWVPVYSVIKIVIDAMSRKPTILPQDGDVNYNLKYFRISLYHATTAAIVIKLGIEKLLG